MMLLLVVLFVVILTATVRELSDVVVVVGFDVLDVPAFLEVVVMLAFAVKLVLVELLSPAVVEVWLLPVVEVIGVTFLMGARLVVLVLTIVAFTI